MIGSDGRNVFFTSFISRLPVPCHWHRARAWMLTALSVEFSNHAQPGTADWLYGPSHAVVCVALSSGEPLPDRKSGTASSLHCRASHLIERCRKAEPGLTVSAASPPWRRCGLVKLNELLVFLPSSRLQSAAQLRQRVAKVDHLWPQSLLLLYI